MEGTLYRTVVTVVVVFSLTSLQHVGAKFKESISCGTENTSCKTFSLSCDPFEEINITKGYFVNKTDGSECSKVLKTCSHENTEKCCKTHHLGQRTPFFTKFELSDVRNQCVRQYNCDILKPPSRPGLVLSVLYYNCFNVSTSPSPTGSTTSAASSVPVRTAAVIGGIVAGVVLMIALVIILYCLMRRIKTTPWKKHIGVSYRDPVASYDNDYMSDIRQPVPDTQRHDYVSLILDSESQPMDGRHDNTGYNHLNGIPPTVNGHYDTTASATEKLKRLACEGGKQATQDDVCYSYNHLKTKDQIPVVNDQYDIAILPQELPKLTVGPDHESEYNISGASVPTITLNNTYDIASVHNKGLGSNEHLIEESVVTPVSKMNNELKPKCDDDTALSDKTNCKIQEKRHKAVIADGTSLSGYLQTGPVHSQPKRKVHDTARKNNQTSSNNYNSVPDPKPVKIPANERRVQPSKIPVLTSIH